MTIFENISLVNSYNSECDFRQTIQMVVIEMKYLNRNFRPVSNVIIPNRSIVKEEFINYILVVFAFEMLRNPFEIVPVSARMKITHFDEMISLN